MRKTTIRERALLVLDRLRLRYPHPETLLEARTPWELVVATVLAAQCTDERVNQVTPVLFARWPDPAALACASQEELEKVVYSTGFYRNKAKNLIGAARRVTEVHGGEVPQTLAELVQLPGVARKTANIVLWGGYGRNEGVAVDTHVKRIVYRLGLTKATDPVAVERDLIRLYLPETWGDLNHMLVWFGRHVCDARKPRCTQCEMNDICPRIGVVDAAKAVTVSKSVQSAQGAPATGGKARVTAAGSQGAPRARQKKGKA